MAEHTAPPWEVVEMTEDHPGFAPRIYGGGSRQKLVAAMGNGEDWHEAYDEWMANARIVSAAPDLLAACVRLVNAQSAIGREGAIRDARAAIRKATGEDPAS